MTSFPSAVSDRRGFALVLSLTIMALLVLVVLTTAGFLNLESRIADMAMRGAMARHNALMSGRLALAQLQLLAGPDQRVTATGGIIDPANTTWGPAPSNPNYAFYTGVWHAGAKADSKGRILSPLQRSANGYLYDTRQTDDASAPPVTGRNADGKIYDWATDRERTTNDSRLLGWLVSGNEGLPLNVATYNGPRAIWTVGAAGRVALVGPGTITTASTEGALGAPTGRIELTPVAMPGPSTSILTGRYAWWVGDEGVKARINLADPYAGATADPLSVSGGYYYRLMTSQRFNFSLVKDYASPVNNYPFSNWDTRSVLTDAATGLNVANSSNFSQLKTAMASAIDLTPLYHDISFTSLGLHTDTQRGGLKRDLTAYLNLGGTSPSAMGSGIIAGVAWTSTSVDAARPMALQGVSDTTDILGDLPWVPEGTNTAFNVWGNSDGAGRSTGPKYGVIRSWYLQKTAWGVNVAASLPVARQSIPTPISPGPTATSLPYIPSDNQNYSVGWLKNQCRTAVHPVLSQFNLWFRPAYDTAATIPTATSTARAYMLVYPRIVMWNPWNVPIASQQYVVDLGHRFVVRARVNYTTSAGGSGTMIFRYGNGAGANFSTSDSNVTQWPGLSPMVFVVPATDFKPGEALVFTAPSANNGTMGTSVTRPYASGGAQVLAPAPLASSVNPTPYFKATITDIPTSGVSTDINDFVVNARKAGGIASATCNFATGPGGGYDFSLQYNVMVAPYGSYAAMTGQTFLLDSTGANAYQAIDTDPYIRSNMGRWISQSEAVAMPYVNLNGAGPTLAPARLNSINYRLMWHDEPAPVGPAKTNIFVTGTNIGYGAIASNHNSQYNLFVQNNTRSPRHFRNPFDLCIWWRTNHDRQFGIWTMDRDPLAMSDNQYAPMDLSGRSRGTPFFSSTNASTSHVYTLYDLPNATLGVVSLGQLQHVPFGEFSWQPSIAFGNGYADPNSPAHTTAYGLTNAYSWPVAANQGVAASMTISAHQADTTPDVGKGTGVAGGTSYFSYMPTAVYQKDEITSSAYYVYDLAFELNAAMWDGWFVSSIPGSNAGWEVSQTVWAPGSTPWDTAASWPNARIVPLGSKQLPSGLPTLYYASASTAVAGAFNVNSTSVRAWTAFLSSQRNLKVPTALAGTDNTGTPFLRNLYPQQGKVQGSVLNASFDKNTWGGYRSLTDAEIQLLATSIVSEVRKRGPFLSLADFINRRLQPVGFDAAKGWTVGDLSQASYTDPANMGTIQAAIEGAIPDNVASPENIDSLNLKENFAGGRKPVRSSPNNLVYTGTTALIQRDNATDFPDPFDTDPKCYHPRGEARVAHRSAGAPGYLMQSDILQQLAPTMTVRSDTFVIRSYGQTTDVSGGRVLAEAWCEMVVQRMPTPCVPETDSSAASVNPKSNYIVNSSGTRTYLRVDLGRRFRILKVRWLAPNEI